MFGKLAADALGLSDIGSVIAPEHFDKVDADDYVMHEDGEKIYFLIKSRADEYCFTNLALIHLDGASAASKKRMLRRYGYGEHRLSKVMLETAGTIDMDIEVKFHIGATAYSIDVHKKHIEQLKDLYKALVRIAELQQQGDTAMEQARTALDTAAGVMHRVGTPGAPVVETFQQLTQAAFEWLATSRKRYAPRDFGTVFERYIHR